MNETVVLYGEIREPYQFEVYPIDSKFEDVGCVYVYSKKINDSWEYIYIGKTNELARRLREHENGNERSDKCIRESGATHIFVYLDDTELSRSQAESDILKGNSFSCNIKENSKSDEDQDFTNKTIKEAFTKPQMRW